MTENCSAPKLLASHSFLSTANFKLSTLNLAYKLVCIARPIPSKTIKSAVCMISHKSKMNKINIDIL